MASKTRTFVYDSLSRLYSATNPESGTTLYRYDANGNLIGKADARTVVTTITVDPLNRVLSAQANPHGHARLAPSNHQTHSDESAESSRAEFLATLDAEAEEDNEAADTL